MNKDEIAEKAAKECADKLFPVCDLTYYSDTVANQNCFTRLLPIIAEACRKASKTEKLCEVVANLTDEYKWNWTRMISQRNAARAFLSLLASRDLIEHAPHPSGGHIWKIGGKIYGRTDGIDPESLTPKETKD